MMSSKTCYLIACIVGPVVFFGHVNGQTSRQSQCVKPTYTVIVTPLKSFLDVYSNSSGTYYTGWVIDVLFAIAAKANFSFVIAEATAPSAFGATNGQVSSSGDACFSSGSGISTFLEKGFDIWASATDVIYQYGAFVDFTVPLFRSSVQIIYNVKAGLNNYTKYAVINQSAGRDVLQVTKNPRLQAIWRNIQANIPTSLPNTYEEAVNLVKYQGYALLGRTPLIDQEVCNSYYQIAKDPTVFKQTYAAFGVQKGNGGLLNTMNLAIMQLSEDNTIQNLLTKWFPCSNFLC